MPLHDEIDNLIESQWAIFPEIRSWLLILIMKSAPKIINLVGKSQRVSEPLKFPLSEEDLSQIESLKYAFRNSFVEYKVYSLGMAAPQIDVWKRFVIMPKIFKYRGQSFKRLRSTVTKFNVYINPVITWKSPS